MSWGLNSAGFSELTWEFRKSTGRKSALVSPPVALTLHVFARILTEIGRAEDEDLEALRPALVASPRAGRDAHHVPLLDLDDLVVELHPPAPAHDHVQLLLLLVRVAVREAIVGRDALVAKAALLELERLLARRNSKSGAPSKLDPRSSGSSLRFLRVNGTSAILPLTLRPAGPRWVSVRARPTGFEPDLRFRRPRRLSRIWLSRAKSIPATRQELARNSPIFRGAPRSEARYRVQPTRRSSRALSPTGGRYRRGVASSCALRRERRRS